MIRLGWSGLLLAKLRMDDRKGKVIEDRGDDATKPHAHRLPLNRPVKLSSSSRFSLSLSLPGFLIEPPKTDRLKSQPKT